MKSDKVYVFEPTAYAKAIMHGCKHASDRVIGVFIGSATDPKVVRIVDAIPLFHTHTLAPMLKIAFMLIEKHCMDNQLEILGFYHASPDGGIDKSPVQPIADKLAANCSNASLWALELQRLAEKKCAMVGMHYSSKEGDKDWRAVSPEAIRVGAEVFEQTERVIAEMKYLDIVDFDEHLTDAKLDWLNSNLFQSDRKFQNLEAPSVEEK
mmetsp:Transcript_91291/g.144261  ORF Transcript_91291/g.144261 Transcript_91291/m.144261 type:complete len:209 (+) Transcript_91291:81-707(+)